MENAVIKEFDGYDVATDTFVPYAGAWGKPIIIDWMTACMGCKYADVVPTGILLKYGQASR